jgi:RimJ/RimL family protein N-acetyltransferase
MQGEAMHALETRRLRLEPVGDAAGLAIARPAVLPAWLTLAFLAGAGKVGEGGLLFVDDDEVHLGYRIAPEHRRQGYAVEGLAAVVALAFGPLGVTSLLAETAIDNTPSQRTLARLGFADTGRRSGRWSERRRSYIYYCLYRLDMSDWKPDP